MVKSVRSLLLVLMAAVAFILLIACINVTNLLLAKAASRRREVAVRAAIGAGRGRLVRQVLVETSVLALAGGAAGIVIALWGVQLLSAQMPPAIRPEQSIVFSVPVMLFTTALCLATGLVAGALPAWHLLRDDLAAALKEGGRSPVSLRRRLRFGLIVAEIALTALLLVGAGLTLRSFRQVLLEPTGFDTDQRLTFVVRLPRARYVTPESFNTFFGSLEQRLANEPSVRLAGATSTLPLSDMPDMRNGIIVDGYERGEEDPPTRAHLRAVTRGYLPAAGVRVVAGRGFLDTDRTGPRIALVNETMARRYWRGRSAIGGRVRLTQEQEWREVIGVVADVKHWGLDAPVNPEMYMPYEQFQQQAMAFVVETAAEPASLAPSVLRHVRELDASLPLSNVRTFDAVAARSVGQRRFTMTLLASFAVLAMVLAAAGIYGVMAHLVALRTAEIGVRLTLGASPSTVMRQVLREGATQAVIGLVIGLGASLGLMPGLRSLLFGVEPTDATTLAAVAVALMLVALLAVAVPALRAMRVNPITALRQ
jgi:putative ABC transport system permease protein